MVWVDGGWGGCDMTIDIGNLILEHFKKLFFNILYNKFFRVVIKGGRSSGKSFFIALAVIIYACVRKKSCLCCLSDKVNVAKRLDNVFIKAFGYLGLVKDVHYRYIQTKHEFIILNKHRKDTLVSIVCTGTDDAEKLKGIQPKQGNWGLLWIEEATGFRNIKQIKNIESSVGRGDINNFTSIISYNPRQSTSHFLNLEFNNINDEDTILEEFNNEDTLTSYVVKDSTIDINGKELRLKQCIFHCTYKELIKQGHADYISPTDLVDIKAGEKTNSEYYRWYYLGEACGSSTLNVFRNIHDINYDDELYKRLLSNNCKRGLDFSNGGDDPYHYGCWYYDRESNSIYCLSELRLPGSAGITDLCSGVKSMMDGNFQIYTDSAVPEFTRQLQNAGVRANGAKKGKDSRYAGIFWLKSLNNIYISKKLTPWTFKEFSNYEYKIDKATEEVLPEIPDGNDHSIDSCRYAFCYDIRDTFYVRSNT